MRIILALFIIIPSFVCYGQDDLLNELSKNEKPTIDYAKATFKGTRVINGHSVETVGKNTLQFMISHRFGKLNDGSYSFFGLDQATIRLAFEYGISNRLTAGLGRSSLQKTFDGYLKYKLLQQSSGAFIMPVSLVLFGSAAINSLNTIPDFEKGFQYRMNYTYQAIIARKFNQNFSFQFSPTLVHRNLVDSALVQNDVIALGFAGRYKLNKRVSLNAEYFYITPGTTADNYQNSASIGFDIETGGHVFQVHLTNSQGMIEKFFIPQTTGNFLKGDIYFGFNVSRAFTVGKH